MNENSDIEEQYWYNVETNKVQLGEQDSNYQALIGPYDTEEEAAGALEQVKANNDKWDEEDEDGPETISDALNVSFGSDDDSESDSDVEKKVATDFTDADLEHDEAIAEDQQVNKKLLEED